MITKVKTKWIMLLSPLLVSSLAASCSSEVNDEPGSENVTSKESSLSEANAGVGRSSVSGSVSTGGASADSSASGGGDYAYESGKTDPKCGGKCKYTKLVPTLKCVEVLKNNKLQAHWGYKNGNSWKVKISIGSNNRFEPTPKDQGQPEKFKAGSFADVFTTKFDKSKTTTWYLDGNSQKASKNSPKCASQECPGGCDDSNPCTTDACVSGQCTHTAVANGTVCSDGNACNGQETCQAGACKAGTPVVCQTTGNACTAGICDSATGTCSNVPVDDGTACNDSNLCTKTDKCVQGTCTGSDPVTCNSPAVCQSAGVCDPASGQCNYSASADGTACDNGNVCDGTDSCQNGSCKGSATSLYSLATNSDQPYAMTKDTQGNLYIATAINLPIDLGGGLLQTAEDDQLDLLINVFRVHRFGADQIVGVVLFQNSHASAAVGQFEANGAGVDL